MIPAPPDTPDDLAERYRQTRGFDEAEMAFVRALLDRPGRLDRELELRLRQALNLARLWVLPGPDGTELNVGTKLAAFRDRLRPLARTLRESRSLDPASLDGELRALGPLLSEAYEGLISAWPGRLLPSVIDAEIGRKSLVLALGGGGGCGYVHLGAFSVLESIGVVPRLIAGSSMGSILGLFRSRELHYREATVRAVTHGLTFKKLFRILQGETKYGLPGTLRLYLRSAMSRFFVGKDGHTMRLSDLDIPFVCMVTGIRREALRTDMREYEQRLAQTLRRGAFGALMHVKDLVASWTSLMSDLIRSGELRSVALGIDAETREFDVLDAVGFSCSVPALIHYDILRPDPRMHALMEGTLRRHGVDHFVDGGVSSNVPARAAWESVQRGRIGTRNAFVLGLDCFAPQLRRNMLFLPLMRLAADNVAKDRSFAQHVFAYDRVLSPAALVPSPRNIQTAVDAGRSEFEALAPLLQKALEPLPPIRRTGGE